MNADVVPIKSLCFALVLKVMDQAKRTVVSMANLLSSNQHISSYLKLYD